MYDEEAYADLIRSEQQAEREALADLLTHRHD